MDFTDSANNPATLDYSEFETAVNAWHEYHRTKSYVLPPVVLSFADKTDQL